MENVEIWLSFLHHDCFEMVDFEEFCIIKTENLKVTFFSLHDLFDNHRSYRSDVRLEYRVKCGFSGEFGHGKEIVAIFV